MKQIEFQVALFKGSEAAKGYLFSVDSEGVTMNFVAHKRAKQWRVSHFETGLCVDHGAPTRAEAVKGFTDAVEVGAFYFPNLALKAQNSPTLNTLPGGGS
ncbi:hypothetical protein [Tateyamaria sp.]|uniref:hypothetical protein n=1 Tax=Tateyamaria sp. TaxID=1929288 RepID=UPI003B2218D0